MRLAPFPVVVLLVTAFVAHTASQTSQGRLTGTVKDEQDAIVPDVTVVATSPTLIGTRTTLTESDGRFLFPALPSGVYTLTFTLSGFKTVVREGVILTVGTTITVDAQLVLTEVRQSVVVTDVSPVVDVATTRVGAHLKDESLMAVPNSTNI